MDCAPSVLTELGEVDDTDNYNLRGNLLHDCGEQKLRTGSYNVEKARANVGMVEPYELTEEDIDSVNTYVDYVNERPGVRWLEVMTWFISKLCGGSSDTVLFDPATGLLEIVDYKAGFVRRYAKANYQLLIYALGCVKWLGLVYDVKKIRLTIIQPQHGIEPNSWDLKPSELNRWGLRISARVSSLEEMRKAGELGTYNPTPERCQFCSVGKAVKCPALEKAARAAATEDFSEFEREKGHDLTEAEKWEIADNAETFIKKIRKRVTDSVLGGTPVAGFKLVSGSGKWGVTDEKGLVGLLTKEGFEERKIFIGEPKLVSHAQAEKLYSGKGSGEKRKALDAFFTKSEGAPSVVVDSDPRPELTTADDDFAKYQRQGDENK